MVLVKEFNFLLRVGLFVGKFNWLLFDNIIWLFLGCFFFFNLNNLFLICMKMIFKINCVYGVLK